jgi:hypothetical protein
MPNHKCEYEYESIWTVTPNRTEPSTTRLKVVSPLYIIYIICIPVYIFLIVLHSIGAFLPIYGAGGRQNYVWVELDLLRGAPV